MPVHSPKSKEFEQQHERYNHPGLQLDKTVVGNGIWKIALHVLANIKTGNNS